MPERRYTGVAHLDTALAYVGVVERGGSNRGSEVERFLRVVGLDGGYAWCAAFVSYALVQAGARTPRGTDGRVLRTAAARRFVTPASLRARDVLRGVVRVPAGSIVVWRRGNSWQGHVGFVVRQVDASTFETVEGNTSSGRGSQFDGDGVWRRRRVIQPGNYFRITRFTQVDY